MARRQIAWVLMCELFCMFALLGWWGTLPTVTRWGRLLQLAHGEGLPLPVPLSIYDQLYWLVTGRGVQLMGCVVLCAIGGVIGSTEGLLRRQRDLFGGFRLGWWRLGWVLGIGAVGSMGLVLVSPWVIPGWAALCGAGILASVGYAIARGWPAW